MRLLDRILRWEPTLDDIVHAASGADVSIRLVPRGERVEGFLNDHVYNVTARAFCKCGDAYHTTSSWMGTMEKMAEFWGEHRPSTVYEHGPTTPELCRRARPGAFIRKPKPSKKHGSRRRTTR